MRISDFFNTDFVDYSSYDNLRKIASAIDGQKNAGRKVIFTVLEKNIKDKIKVSQLGSKVSEFAEYLHGNMDGVIVNLAQDFIGTNNISLLQKKGNFGTRFTPEASASRYIFTHGSKAFFEILKKEDIPVLKKQFFEGNEIEPVFYVPTLPILVINGAEGVSSGFAQKILPRDPKIVKKYIKAKIKGRKTPELIPYYEGFDGTIVQGEKSNQWFINGIAKKTGINKVKITEIPIGYNLKSYIKVLDSLEDKKIIQSYRDKCDEDDKFIFEVTIQSKILKDLSEFDLIDKLKLIKTVSENYTVMDENNKIAVHDSIYGIIDYYIEVKQRYMQLRKDHLIQKYIDENKFNFSKFVFIEKIVNNELVINKRKKADIVNDLISINDIIEKDGNYDYLLNLNIMSLTEERMEKLIEDIDKREKLIEELKKKDINEMIIEEL